MTIRGFRQGRVAHLAAVVTAALFAVGTPAAWAGPAASAKPATALEVQSEPAGAAVYVDGQLKGATPVAVEGVVSGDHTVRVVKDGFLENSRVVSVPATGRSLRVALTPTRTSPRASMMMQVEPEEPAESGGGGGGKKWVFIGLGAALLAGGTAALLLAGGNEAPKVTSVTANPTTALVAATIVSFTAAATDDDSLTYSWNFGDGGTGSGASVSHMYASAGTFNVSVDVSDGKKTTTGSTSVTARSLAGAWSGRITGGFSYSCNLAQSGAAVSGNCSDGSRAWTIAGSVSTPMAVNLTASRSGFAPWYMRGYASGDINSITGTTSGLVNSNGVPVTPDFTLSR